MSNTSSLPDLEPDPTPASQGTEARAESEARADSEAREGSEPARPLSSATSPAPRPHRKRRPFLILAALAAVVLSVIGAYAIVTANQESTDDAQVEADIIPVGTRVSGQVSQVLIKDNQRVEAGQVLVSLDQADFEAKVLQAEAQLETATAQAAAADAQVAIAEADAKGGLTTARAMVTGSSQAVSSAGAQIAAAQATLQRAEAEAHRTAIDLERVRRLAAKNAAPQQQLDHAQAADDAAQAAVAQAKAQLAAARQSKRVAQSQVAQARGRLDQSMPIESQIEVARANADLARATVKSAQAALELAKLKLSYTRIVAPADGFISKLSVHPGQLVQAGQTIAEFVPTKTFVIANFKETQLEDIRTGQKATIELDAYPGREFSARVESLSGATGARFALLPPDNASGNFVKVVQRVPVRLSWEKPPTIPVRAGLSAEVTVHTK